MVEITRRIEAEKEKSASKRGTAFGEVDVVVVADEESTVELKLTYSSSSIPPLAVNEINISSSRQQCSMETHLRASCYHRER